MNPAATLSILVKAQGLQQTSGQLGKLDTSAKRAAVGMGNTEKAAKRAGHAHIQAAKAVAGFVGAYAAVSTIKSSVKTTETLAKTTLTLAKGFGLATNAASEWAAVSQARGTEGKALAMGFKSLATQTRNAAKGSKEGAAAFKELGISQRDLKKHGNDLNWLLHRVSDGLAELPAGTNKAAIQARLFGRTWIALSPLVRDGSKAMDEQLSVARKYGATIGGKSIKSVQDFIKAQREAKLAEMGLSVTIGTTLIPILTKSIGSIAEFASGMRKGSGAAGQFRTLVAGVLGVLKPFAKSIIDIVVWQTKQTGVAKILIPTFAALAVAIWAVNAAMAANPFTLAAVAIAALTVGIVTAYRESATFRDIVNSVVAAVGPTFQAAFAVATQVVLSLPAAFRTAVGAIVSAFNTVKAAVSSLTGTITKEVGSWKVLFAVFGVIATIVKFNMGVVVAVVRSALALIAPLFTATFGVLKAIVAGAFNAMKAIVQGGLQVVHGVIQVFGGIFKGDFHQMWEGIKNIFKGIGSAISGILRAQLGTVAAAGKALGKGLLDSFKAALNFAHELAVQMRDLISKAPGYALGVGKAIVRGIIAGFKSAAGAIGGVVSGALKSAVPDVFGVGDGLGKSIGAGSIAPVKGGGSLMGARPIMSKFAAVGAAKGLHVTSGMRAGAITSSGNPSWHSTGEAVDLGNGAGPDAAKMSVFKTLRSRFGSRLAELIYGPGVVGIKNGQPYNFGGALNARHMDHVHVAFDSGKPGQGDGLGKMSRRKPGTGDGIGVAIAAARKAGFTGEDLVRMVAIAGRESHYNPRAANYKPPDHSIGLWQINQLAHHGRFGTDRELMDPDTNAHAAWVLSGGGKNFSPWSTNKGLSASYLKAARDAINRGAGGTATAPASKGGGGGSGGGGAAQKVGNYEMISAMADTALASAASTPGVADDTLANTQLRDATTFRIKQVRKALKKPNLTPAKRLSLTQELGGLVSKHTELQSTLKDLRTQPAFDALDKQTGINDARLSIAQGTETLADDLAPLQARVDILGKVFELTQKKFGAGSAEAAQAFADLTGAAQTLAKTQRDAVFQPFQQGITHGQAALTMAQVWSPKDFGDDLAALQFSLDSASAGFDTAVSMGDEAGIIEFGGQVLSLRDAIAQLSANVEENTKAQLDLQTQLKEAAQRNFNVSQTELGTLQKAIAAVANREIGGGTGLGFMSPSFAGGGTRY